MTAQRLADEISDNAHKQAATIIKDAESRASLILEKAQARYEDVQREIDGLRLKRREVESSVESVDRVAQEHPRFRARAGRARPRREDPPAPAPHHRLARGDARLEPGPQGRRPGGHRAPRLDPAPPCRPARSSATPGWCSPAPAARPSAARPRRTRGPVRDASIVAADGVIDVRRAAGRSRPPLPARLRRDRHRRLRLHGGARLRRSAHARRLRRRSPRGTPPPARRRDLRRDRRRRRRHPLHRARHARRQRGRTGVGHAGAPRPDAALRHDDVRGQERVRPPGRRGAEDAARHPPAERRARRSTWSRRSWAPTRSRSSTARTAASTSTSSCAR